MNVTTFRASRPDRPQNRKTDLIAVNPADKVDRPRKNEFTGSFYSKEEMNALFDAVKGSKVEIPVLLAAFYGLRRSEVIGLKWDAINFERNTIEIRHTVTCIKMDGKKQLIESDSTKTKSSKRTLPLVPLFREKLLALQQEQEENRRVLCTKNRHSAPKRTLCRFWRSIRDLNPGGAVNALSHFEFCVPNAVCAPPGSKQAVSSRPF